MSTNSFEILSCAYPIIKETVPQSALGYRTNNKYPEFPPLMNDGRAVTASYQPEAVLNEKLIRSNNIQSNWQYRRYLTNHAKEIMEYNFREASTDAGYFTRHSELPSIDKNQVVGFSSTPYLYSSAIDTSKPKGYETSDLKDIYLSREQLDARRISPVVTQDEFIQAKI
jgi:hypothetical protein